jgi:short chain dehydrogenase
MAGRLAGKVAVVTGAAPRGEGVGNGMATAILFAREGAKVVLVNRSAERAEKLARQIKDEGGEASVFAGDVAKAEAAEAMAEFAAKTYGRLDILHNNVGIGAPGTPETVTPVDWAKVLEANLTTTMLCSKYCIPKMKAGGGGSIIMPDGQPRRRRLLDGQGGAAWLHPVGGGRLRHAEHPRQLHHRGLGAHAHGGTSRRRGARTAQEDGAHADRGYGVGHRLRRGLSRVRRIALGHRRAAADRRRPDGAQGVAALGF